MILWLIVAPGALILLLLLSKGAFESWRTAVVPEDAPRIAMSVDTTWLNEIGLTRAMYEQALIRVGGELVPVKPGDDPLTVLEGIDGLYITGGGDVDPELYGGDPDAGFLVDRARDDFEIALIKEARRRRIPILGICRGCQIINVAQGGTLRNLRSEDELKDVHFGLSGHGVTIEPGGILANAVTVEPSDRVLSYHGQAVGTPGDGVRVVARSDDGVVEAIEVGGPGEWVVAVQWHPELDFSDPRQLDLFRAFIEEAKGGH